MSHSVDPDAFSEQKQLVEAALALKGEAVEAPTVAEVCAAAQVNVEVFHRHFHRVAELQPAFYDLIIPQYRILTGATEGYDDFTFEERLASFYYIVLDALGEQRDFVTQTFDTRVRRRSSFRRDVRRALRDILTGKQVPAPNQLVTGVWPVHEVLTVVTMAIIRHWIRDDTDKQAATTALVDKLVAFVAELVTFRGVSRGLTLAWHIVQHDTLGLRRIPIVGWFVPRPDDPPSSS